MRRVFSALLLVFLCAIISLPMSQAEAAKRQKSSVVTIYVNNAETSFNKSLDDIVKAELDKRLEGVYIELDNEEYLPYYRNKTFVAATQKRLMEGVKSSGAKYMIYLELLPFDKTENYNLIYHRRGATASMFVWLINLETGQSIYRESFKLNEMDSSDGWFIGDASVARGALKTTMFKVGEIISVYLPL